MNKSRKAVMLLFMFVMLFAVSITASAASPKLSKKSVSIKTGDTYKLTVKNASGQITFKSSKSAVAAVSSNGLITAKKAGSATITVKVGKNTLKCKVTVKPVKVTKVTLPGKVSVTVNGTCSLTPTITPSNAANKKVKWSSSNKKIATVDANGVVTGKKKGTVKITATAADGSKKKAVCTITVTDAPSKPSSSTNSLTPSGSGSSINNPAKPSSTNTSSNSVIKRDSSTSLHSGDVLDSNFSSVKIESYSTWQHVRIVLHGSGGWNDISKMDCTKLQFEADDPNLVGIEISPLNAKDWENYPSYINASAICIIYVKQPVRQNFSTYVTVRYMGLSKRIRVDVGEFAQTGLQSIPYDTVLMATKYYKEHPYTAQ